MIRSSQRCRSRCFLVEAAARPVANNRRRFGKQRPLYMAYNQQTPNRLYFRLEARDAAGNIGVSESIEPIMLDQTIPTGKLRSVRLCGRRCCPAVISRKRMAPFERAAQQSQQQLNLPTLAPPISTTQVPAPGLASNPSNDRWNSGTRLSDSFTPIQPQMVENPFVEPPRVGRPACGAESITPRSSLLATQKLR